MRQTKEQEKRGPLSKRETSHGSRLENSQKKEEEREDRGRVKKKAREKKILNR